MVKMFPNLRTPLFPNILSFTELKRVTLGGTSTNIQLTNLPKKRWLMVLCDLRMTGALVPWLRMNNISTGTSYSDRQSANGGVDTTDVNANQIILSSSSATPQFIVILIETYPNGDILIESHAIDQGTAGAGNATNRFEAVGKLAPTPTYGINVTEIDIVPSTSSFASGSEVVVLGSDESDVNVTPFFKELGRVKGDGTVNMIASGLTAMKYMFFTTWQTLQVTTFVTRMRFNADTAGNYNDRNSVNGGADGTTANDTSIDLMARQSTPAYQDGFILNVSANEKLMIWWDIEQLTAGAANIPSRLEGTAKWTNTATQITEIDLVETDGNGFSSLSELVVYGGN